MIHRLAAAALLPCCRQAHLDCDRYTSHLQQLLPCPCRQAQQQQPRETLEQHLYAFLTQKYGMRQLIMEWLSAILAAVEHFAPRDADVALFDKVLRHAPASCSCVIGWCHPVLLRTSVHGGTLMRPSLTELPRHSPCHHLLTLNRLSAIPTARIAVHGGVLA